MKDPENADSEFDRHVDRILTEMGVGPDADPIKFTFERGIELGTRLLTAVLADPRVAQSIAEDVLNEYGAMFPRDPDPDTIEVQAYFWAPWVSKWLTGRGLTVPQIAKVARVDSDHVYRLMRNGLRIIFVEAEPPTPTGVNRRYSGVDDRGTYLLPDASGLTDRPWPSGAEEFRPFIRGLLAGVQRSVVDTRTQAELEPVFMAAFSSALRNPALRDVAEGAIAAIQRIAIDLRDRVLTMNAEKERATSLARVLSELGASKEQVFAMLEQAAARLDQNGIEVVGGGRP